LQRLFLMNSDFVQLQAEALAKRVAAEPDNRARIRKMYSLTYGRAPSDEEIQLGLAYLHSEPMQEYGESNEVKSNTKDAKSPDAVTSVPPGMALAKTAADTATPSSATPEALETPAEGEATTDAAIGMGMMGGMGLNGKRGEAPAKPDVKYEPTVWGRYAKVLLSSTEFIFIN
jgi:hypothetical protein